MIVQRPTPRRRLAGVVAAALLTVGLLVGCGAADDASPTTGGAQSSLPAPVSAESSEPSTPIRVIVDGAEAVVDSVATDAAGVLLPPQDVGRLGWWVDSSLPGSGAGTIVVTGHVDDVDQGSGFAARFTPLTVGSIVEVATADGTAHRYRVTSSALTDKQRTGDGGLPTAELNRTDGPETLALVTCGGPFVGPPLGYRDNVVVFAVPA
ncbi:class F sortase [Gordonia sp. (in: high G+C Gram-positive bacteria)]|uniref:class F sortase n=1 Tax=Gordonia sp. (in: high G+C Gram-positive bacteria) TaxID=84139 RepID=UPI001690B7E7|nr:class F sortase [Gordonia sp. (in: high G+C Gram-positive bacteria)]NLG46551.1 class F sortase [Gordonia sp. (in: high G+C Gram-positive bacteria)]